MSVEETYRLWCESSYFDESTKEELRAIKHDKIEIQERFCKNLEFGTGGLRGIIGAGTNRINLYTVRLVTQGLADYINAMGMGYKGVAIAFDSREMSKEFAREAALCLNANGIAAYRFLELRPTPELSFAVRRLGCAAGIMITASHNPAKYNGYKVYWEDGAQITSSIDTGIMDCIGKLKQWSQIRTMEEVDARERKLYQIIGGEMDLAYIETIQSLILRPDVVQEMKGKLSIVYTPLHGAGMESVRHMLDAMGFVHVHVVKEQELPDGLFPTVPYPNPEEFSVFALALNLAEKVDADVVLATDPDADRLGAYVKETKTGRYQQLTGNMTGILLCDYILSQRKLLGRLPEHGAVVKTIVTTNMVYPLAKEYGVSVFEVLTGFKYIGEKIKEFEEQGNYKYLFGFEESYGCLTGTYARDKDAVSAAALLCEAAAFYKQQGSSLWERLEFLYDKYGYFEEMLVTKTKEGTQGMEQIRSMMEKMRKNPPAKIDGKRVLKVRDYLNGKNTSNAGLPASDVLYYELENNGWYCIRPSGTEPKIKYYSGSCKERP